MSEPLVLYSFSDTDRSGKVRWLAAELGLPVEERRVEFPTHRKPPYTELNPFAQVPTVVFRGRTLFESTAICHEVAEAFETPKLWVGRGEPERTSYLFWLGVFGETLEGRLVECTLSKVGLLPETYFSLHERAVRFKLKVAASRLPREGYLAGSAFSVADIVAGYNLRLAISAGLVERDAVEPYLGRLVERPAAQESRVFATLG